MTPRADAARLLAAADPLSADSLFRATASAVRDGLWEEALPPLRAGIANHPDDARIWQMLGLALRNLEELEPALEALHRAAALAPADALIAHTLARAALEAGLPATDLFERAHALAPKDGSVLLGRAAAQLAEDRLADAVEALIPHLRENPGWLPGHATLCRLRWLAGERETFTASWEEAVSAAPREIAIWRGWADTLMQADLWDGALAVVAGGRAAAGPHLVFDALETVAVAEKGDIEAADALFAALGPIEHVSMAARYLRHLLRAGRPVEAAAYAEPWLSGPDADYVWPYVATAWRMTGDRRRDWLEGDERLVGIYDLADEIPSLDALAARLRAIHQDLHQPLEQSVRGGTQTDGPLFARIEPEIRALRAAILGAVERHIAGLPPPVAGHPTLIADRGPVRFSGSWSVRLAGAGFHSNHIHPAGWLSSAFYVTLPDTSRGHEGWLKLGEPQAELALDVPPFRHIEPKPGRLVLFPSIMWHGTEPFAAGERMTVAFDVAKPS